MKSQDIENESSKPWPGHKLFDPANYTGEEYVILFLLTFILFVIIKHLIFHTLFYWWFGKARFYIPRTLRNLLSRTLFHDRLYSFIKAQSSEEQIKSASSVAELISTYCELKEFALNTGSEKGEILAKLANVHMPSSVLIYRPNCGYVLMKLLSVLPQESHVYLIEPEEEFISLNKQLAKLVGAGSQVIVLKSLWEDGIKELRSNYSKKLDFVFLNRTGYNQASHKDFVKDLEDLKMLQKRTDEQSGTCIVSDKVVHIGDAEFLKYVRSSDSYDTKYYQMTLENSPEDLVDAMESAVYLG